jgi:hypothetical protein
VDDSLWKNREVWGFRYGFLLILLAIHLAINIVFFLVWGGCQWDETVSRFLRHIDGDWALGRMSSPKSFLILQLSNHDRRFEFRPCDGWKIGGNESQFACDNLTL